ncbi:methionine--tRNA ligase [Buchnera aphidicola (Mollitrichosiphum nigrofasciatum)]|uniref:methionine--tRNA ligase n=1 Tax=Buchnera aphidicola TaxID=9 RepID=UPI0031B83F2D
MKKIKKRKILVTCALPYANGLIHLGHIMEHIQADIWVRFHRMLNNKIWFICSGDTHGTAIMLKCKKEKIKPKIYVKKIIKEQKDIFLKFNISHDNYYSTHTKEHLYYVNKLFLILKKKKLINKKTIYQWFDSKFNIFLPDRLVLGTCPICRSNKQYGDNCESCGSVYSALDLIKPISVLSNTKPILKNSVHLFFNLPYFTNMLKNWTASDVLQKTVYNKIKEWLLKGLKEWDISRDAPYFGFKIPFYTNKYFYVWFDAPIGYISSFKNLCDKNKNINFKKFWVKSSNYELYHFIGKDIIYFHSLFWPAVLHGCDFKKPTKIFAHGYVLFNGCKMSKSRGVNITAKNWLKYFDSDSLRYYYASKLSNGIEDIDINIKQFINKINSDLLNKIVNLASRSAKIINVRFNSFLSTKIEDIDLYNYFLKISNNIIYNFNKLNFNIVISEIIELANLANKYINDKKPWTYKEKFYFDNKIHRIFSMGINFFKIIMTCLKPITPILAQNSEIFLKISLLWENINQPLLNHKISIYKNLYQKINENIKYNF